MLSKWPEVELGEQTFPELLAAVEAIDVGPASENTCLGGMDASERLIRHLEAKKAQLAEHAANLAGRAQVAPSGRAGDAIDGIELIAAEVGLAVGLTRGEAISSVGESVLVYQELPAIWELVYAGRLDWRVAVRTHTQMRECLRPGSPEWEKVQADLVKLLPGKSRGAARRATERKIQEVDAEAAQKRYRKAQKERYVRAFPLADGMGGLNVKLRADEARMVHATLDALADGCRDQARRTGNPDPRTHEQRRADAFVALFRSVHAGNPLPIIGTDDPGADDDALGGRVVPAEHPLAPRSPDAPRSILAWWLPPTLPHQQGRKPHLVVTISADTLRRLNDRPGELEGFGAIPAELAREIAQQAGKVTLVPVQEQRRPGPAPTHGPGDQANCTEQSRRYKPRQTVIDQVVGRFPTCVHPGCTRPSAQCDVDHAIPFAKGGRSCPCNLVPLCRAHHRLKTIGGWSLRLTTPEEPHPLGSIEFHSRLGQRHVEPPPHLTGPADAGSAPSPDEEADAETRADLREEAWQSELRRVAPPRDQAASAHVGTQGPPSADESAGDLGEPPF